MEDSAAEAVDKFVGHLHEASRDDKYLFDWSLPLFCPPLAAEVIIQKYFANDFLQRTPPGRYHLCDSLSPLLLFPVTLSTVRSFIVQFIMSRE